MGGDSIKIKVKLSSPTNLKAHDTAAGSIIEIDIEEYLKAVVASEIGNSHIEACKAQAVAARTFAMRRMKNRGVLTDGTGDQVYLATRNDPVRYPNAIRAVEETKGLILTYKGHLLLDAPYGASNGGHTASYKNYPYLISKPDPWDKEETGKRIAAGQQIKVGNKTGLSQYGARYAASIGVGYREILDFYYPYTDISSNYGQEEVNNLRVKNAKELALIEWAKKQVGCGYVWGATGQTLTQASLNALVSKHGRNINVNVVSKWMGKKVFDCASLVSEALKRHLDLKVTSGASSMWKGANWDVKNTIDTLPKEYVCIVFRTSPDSNPMKHVGIYLGDGTVIDARGSASGVLHKDLAAYPWTHWAMPRGLLSAAEIAAIKKTLNENMDTGKDTTDMRTARVIANKLALRNDMNTNNNPITRLENGTVVELLEKTNASWWKIKWNGRIGYVMSQYMIEQNAAPGSPSVDDADGGADEIEDNQFAVHIMCKDEAEAKRILELLKGAVMG